MKHLPTKNCAMAIAFLLTIILANPSNIVGMAYPGEVIKDHSMEITNIFNNFDALFKFNTEASEESLLAGSQCPEMPVNQAPPICVMSNDELKEIEKAIIDDRKGASQSESFNIIYSANNCSALDKFKIEILKIKNDFMALTKEKISSAKYNELKANYESQLKKCEKRLDEIKKKASHKRLETIGRLETELQLQQNQITKILNKLETEQKSMNDAFVRLCISRIENGQLDEAAVVFRNVTDQEIGIERIAISVYAGDAENFENIFQFMARIHWTPSRINGYKVLHEEMKKNNQWRNANMWMLATAVVDIMFTTTVVKISEPPIGLTRLTEEMINDLKTIVRDNDFDGVVEFANERGKKGVDSVAYFSPLFIQTIYGENKTVDKVLNVIHKLTFNTHRLNLLNELVTTMKSTYHMQGTEVSMIVFELIKLRVEIQRSLEVRDESLLKAIEQNLPEELRDLMYKNLCIQNKENNEFLYAGSPADEDRRHIYTSKTRTIDNSFYWQFNFVEKGKMILIQNIKHRENVYLMDEGKNDEDHVLRSWIPGTLKGDGQAEFSLDMIGDGQFLIINNHYGQLLYSPFDGERSDNQKRPVFSKKYDPNDISIDSIWKIGICRLNVEYDF